MKWQQVPAGKQAYKDFFVAIAKIIAMNTCSGRTAFAHVQFSKDATISFEAPIIDDETSIVNIPLPVSAERSKEILEPESDHVLVRPQ